MTPGRLLCTGLLAAAAATAAAQPVQAPHYGDVLFHHYQGRWVAALGSLDASRHFGRLAPHDGDAELLRGGLLLDGGQHDEAATVFEQVAAQHPLHRDRAWTMLARARWQRGQVDAAADALARVQAPLTDAVGETERRLLHALVLLARGQAAAALPALQPLAELRPGTNGAPVNGVAVARFNLAVALLQAGRADEARRALDALGRVRAADEEQRILRDQANVALGRQALMHGDDGAARAALQRVRLHGPDAAQALLAEGLAALRQGRSAEAAIAWAEGAGRRVDDDAVLEARLALPQAYAHGGARGRAVQMTEQLLAQLLGDRQALSAARDAVQQGGALQPLFDTFASYEPGDGTDTADRLPRGGAHAAALRPVWADHAFQTALARWADLQWATRRLAQGQRALVSFEELRALRLQGYAERLPAVLAAAQDDGRGLAALQRAHDTWAATLAAATDDDDHLLADDDEHAQLARLQRMQADLAALADDPAHAPLADRVRRVAGLLQWRLAVTRAERRRAAQQSLAGLQRRLDVARDKAAALQRARDEEPQRLADLGQRLTQAAAAIAAVQPRVLALADEQRLALQGLAVAALDARAARLAAVELRARLLLVQLQDGSWSSARLGGPDEAGDVTR